MYMTASSVKIINKRNVFVMYPSKSTRMVSCGDLYVCSWAVIFPLQLLLKSLSSVHDDRLFCYVLIHDAVFLPVIYQYSCFFV